ncbi:MAG: hypothetical protein DRI24_20795 [Deltaproteobacteria bacterium]|nr:MAG: hypothetical protein DRI24_20795 [Deltaproteobacteria bacterium]
MLSRDSIIQEIQILEAIEKRKCERSLAEFVKLSWHIIEPSTKLIWNWHFDVICGYLEAVTSGKIKRLIINVPPGTAKSTLVSVCFPAWEWIHNPARRYLGITNEQGLALRDSLKAKTIIESQWFQSKWPIKFNPRQNEKILYQNVDTGFRQSLGITAGLTGKRGNCFAGNVKVLTETGLKYIKDVCIGESVWSINVLSGEKSLNKVRGTIRKKDCSVVEVFLNDGTSIECTPEHRFLTTTGMVRADELAVSTPLNVINVPDAYRIKTLITFDGKPLLVSRVIKSRHKVDTFCLDVANNHTLFVGKSKDSLIPVSNCLLLDDCHDSTQVESDLQRQTVLDAYDYKISTRLNDPDNDAIILIMQRLHFNDLTGHLLQKKHNKWVHVSIPMEYEGSQGFDAGRDIGRPELIYPRTKDGELLFPERFNRKTVNSLKEDLGEYGSSGQLQQRPVPKGGGILKEKWWLVWPDDKPLPMVEHLFCSWDTAYSEADLKNNAYSAMTMFGVFWHEQKQRYCLLMTKAWAGQVGFPDLRRKAKSIDEEEKLDCQLIEKKASGISLVQDLKQSGIKIRTYTPDRDKVARAYSVSSMLESGQVYIPNRKWAQKVIALVSQFPHGAPPSADFTDTITQALIYLRNSWWVSHKDDAINNDINDRHDEIAKQDIAWDMYEDELNIQRTNDRTAAYG